MDRRDEELHVLSGPSERELEEVEETVPALAVPQMGLVVPHDDAVALLVEAGFKTAEKWPVEKISRYFCDLADRVVRADLADDDLLVLYDDVADANRQAAPVLIGETSPKLRPGPKMGRGKAQRRRPGIMKHILRMLENDASELRPLTKKEVYDRIMERFPDRDAESTWTTVYCFPNWAAGYYDVDMHKRGDGYWMTRSYTGKFRRGKQYRTRRVRE